MKNWYQLGQIRKDLLYASNQPTNASGTDLCKWLGHSWSHWHAGCLAQNTKKKKCVIIYTHKIHTCSWLDDVRRHSKRCCQFLDLKHNWDMLLHGSAPNYTAWKQKKLDQLLLKRACHHCSTVIAVIGVSPTRLHPMDSAGGAYSNSHSSDCHCWNDGKNEPGQDPRNSAACKNYDSDPWGCFSWITSKCWAENFSWLLLTWHVDFSVVVSYRTFQTTGCGKRLT